MEMINKYQFSELVELHQFSMYRLVKSILINEHDVEDAISSALLKAYESRNTIRDINCFKSWILKIVSNESYTILRKKKNIIYVDEIKENQYISDEHESPYEVWESIQRLEEKFRAIIVLFYYEDLSVKSISNILNVNQNTVKVRLFRARQKLKVELAKQGGLRSE
jgi:RNA polymerase sigma-70 factor (ECF subfamily)